MMFRAGQQSYANQHYAVVHNSAQVYGGQIWEVSYPAGVLRRITNDLSMYTGVFVDASGQNLP